MADRTVEVETKFTVDTAQAEAGGARLKAAFERLHSVTGRLHERITGSAREMAVMGLGALGLGVGLHALGEKVISANEELEKMTKRVAGTLYAFRSWKDGVTPVQAVTASLSDAREIMDKFERVEDEFAVPIESVTGAFNTLIGPMQQVGASEEQVVSMARLSGAAMRVLGVDAQYAASQIARMIVTRRIPMRATDPMTAFLRQTFAGFHDLKKLKPEKLLETVEHQLSSLGKAAPTMATGLDATLFRLKDFIHDTLRDVGKPTFEFIAQKLEAWREKINAVTDGGKKVVEVYGERVLGAVKTIASVSGTILEHWRSIVTLVGGLKLTQAISSGGALGGMFGQLRAFGLALGPVVAGLTVFATAVQTAADFLVDHFGKKAEMRAGTAGFEPGFAALRQGTLTPKAARQIFGADVFDPGGKLVPAKLIGKMSAMDVEQGRAFAAALGMSKPGGRRGTFSQEEIAAAAARMGLRGEAKFPEFGPPISAMGLTKPPRVVANFNGPININQKFEEADPDDVYVRFREDLEAAAEKRVQSPIQDTFGPHPVR